MKMWLISVSSRFFLYSLIIVPLWIEFDINAIRQFDSLSNSRENDQLSKYGDTKTARTVMLAEVKKLIEANPLFRDKLTFPTLRSSRLRTLINQRCVSISFSPDNYIICCSLWTCSLAVLIGSTSCAKVLGQTQILKLYSQTTRAQFPMVLWHLHQSISLLQLWRSQQLFRHLELMV